VTRWVCLDVGETIIDETRVWETWADILGVTRFTFIAAIGAMLAHGRPFQEVFEFLGFEDPSNPSSLETLIRMLGAEPVDYDGKDKCCGFMTLTVEENNSMKLTGRQLGNAKLAGADLVVTPCPLCHLTLDVYQPEASRARMMDIDLPVLHLPQLVGLAMGLSPAELGLHRNVQSPKKVLAKVG